jgi:hypothetical protein
MRKMKPFISKRKSKTKRAESMQNQPFSLSNFSPFRAIAAWTGWKCIRIIIQSDNCAAFHTFVRTFSRFFSSSVHCKKFKWLITGLCAIESIKTILRTLFCRSNFYCFSNCCSWPFSGLTCWNELSVSSISNSCRSLTHDYKI